MDMEFWSNIAARKHNKFKSMRKMISKPSHVVPIDVELSDRYCYED